jgi:succinate-semialdehyde dehydrogenase/glutarate-semialdehyde dehydrogenase
MSATIATSFGKEEVVSFNPATGQEVGRVHQASEREVKEAVARAREAQKEWSKLPFRVRGKYIMRAREVLLAQMDETARLICDEMGKPVAEALSADIAPVLDLMQYFARKSERLLRPEKLGVGLYGWLGRSSKIIYTPVGVVGIISPWNFPLSIPLGEVTMALMAGNTVVLKPSEVTAMVGLKIGEIFEKAGLPENVLGVVSGGGSVGAALVTSGVDKIMFTGSVATGKKIAAVAAESLTPVVLELGGKDPMIVCRDADLEMAARAAVWGAFTNSGQACSSVERVYVHNSIAQEFTRRVVEKTMELTQNYGSDADTEVASMSSERQLKIVEDHVEDFKKAGAEILTGGARNNVFPDGVFFEPTVIGGATNEMRGMREETFGPTMPIAVFVDESDAVRLANDTEFGLTASVWTKDIARGRTLAAQIRAGTVMVNEVLYTHGIGQTPWGGFGHSGYGRTHGRLGLMELVAPQHIHVNRFTIFADMWWFNYNADTVELFRGLARRFATGSLFQTAMLLPQFLKRIREMRRKP